MILMKLSTMASPVFPTPLPLGKGERSVLHAITELNYRFVSFAIIFICINKLHRKI